MMQEHLIKLGIHAPEARQATEDEKTLQRIEERDRRRENIWTETVAKVEEMSKDQLEDRDAFRDALRTHAGREDREKNERKHSGAGTYGERIGSRDADEDDDDDDDDDLFKDDDDERTLEAIRAQRIAELRAMQQAKMASASRSGATTTQGGEKIIGGVKLIEPTEFQSEILSSVEAGLYVAMLIVVPNSAACEHMLRIMKELGGQFPSLKVIAMFASPQIKNFPPEHSPALLVYCPKTKTRPMAQFSTLNAFRGPKTTKEDVEWKLACLGVINSELTEDPSEATLFEKSERRID